MFRMIGDSLPSQASLEIKMAPKGARLHVTIVKAAAQRPIWWSEPARWPKLELSEHSSQRY